MPAIPIYSASPITAAAKPDGVTPQTAQAGDLPTPRQDTVKPTPASAYQPYPAAQPEARPPAPTGAPQPSTSYYAPTPTQRTADAGGPPAPQPGAAPTTTRGGSNLPPPPKAGESFQNPPAAQITQAPMPPQMSYAPPTGSDYGPARSSTTTSSQLLGLGPTSLPDNGLAHPPGYQQNINASEFDSHQRAAHNAFVAENPNKRLSFTGDGDEEGVWNTAKKWAAAAGDGLASVENEVWKRINKD